VKQKQTRPGQKDAIRQFTIKDMVKLLKVNTIMTNKKKILKGINCIPQLQVSKWMMPCRRPIPGYSV
jgi:hypothetical protein